MKISEALHVQVWRVVFGVLVLGLTVILTLAVTVTPSRQVQHHDVVTIATTSSNQRQTVALIIETETAHTVRVTADTPCGYRPGWYASGPFPGPGGYLVVQWCLSAGIIYLSPTGSDDLMSEVSAVEARAWVSALNAAYAAKYGRDQI